MVPPLAAAGYPLDSTQTARIQWEIHRSSKGLKSSIPATPLCNHVLRYLFDRSHFFPSPFIRLTRTAIGVSSNAAELNVIGKVDIGEAVAVVSDR